MNHHHVDASNYVETFPQLRFLHVFGFMTGTQSIYNLNLEPNHYPIWFRQQRILLDELQPAQGFNSVSWAGGDILHHHETWPSTNQRIVCSFTEGSRSEFGLFPKFRRKHELYFESMWLNTPVGTGSVGELQRKWELFFDITEFNSEQHNIPYFEDAFDDNQGVA